MFRLLIAFACQVLTYYGIMLIFSITIDQTGLVICNQQPLEHIQKKPQIALLPIVLSASKLTVIYSVLQCILQRSCQNLVLKLHAQTLIILYTYKIFQDIKISRNGHCNAFKGVSINNEFPRTHWECNEKLRVKRWY